MQIQVEVAVTFSDFDEEGYLLANPDVAASVRSTNLNRWSGGRQHFEMMGHKEGRKQRQIAAIRSMRSIKMSALEPYLMKELSHTLNAGKYDFLSDALRAEAGIADTDHVSQNQYDPYVEGLIKECSSGLVLDCGSGSRPVYYDNVVNYEIVNYETTDVIGVGEQLPFRDGTFDGVVSLSVLEHVRNPFKCASELVRVLKPGGKIVCAAPFLAPYHGYPHHYFNMSHQGLKSLFDTAIDIQFHEVIESTLPIWTLTWIVQSWARGLDERTRAEFLNQPIATLMDNPLTLLSKPWVKKLPREVNFELASGTMLIGQKRH